MTKRVHGNSEVRNSHHKLDDDKVRAIKRMWHDNPTLSQDAIGKQFGVSHKTVSYIISGKSWSHVSLDNE